MNAYSRDTMTSFVPDQTNTRVLRDAFGRFATGVTVVSCTSEAGPVTITANSFSSISMDPPLVMWAAGRSSRRYPAFANAKHFAIHILAADQQELCNTFSTDGFALQNIDHVTNVEGVPLISGCLACFECKLSAIHEAGDHSIIVGEVLRAQQRQGDALAFFGGKFARLAQP